MAGDFLASIRPWPIEDIEIGDRVFRIPALTADRWLELLLASPVSLWSLVPGLLEGDDAGEHLEELMISGELDRDDYEQMCWEIVGVAAGREWWTALHLLGNAAAPSNRDLVLGQLALAGVDATRISLSAFLDAVYMIFARHMKDTDRQKFDLALARPPAGVKVQLDPQRQRDAFEQVMGSG